MRVAIYETPRPHEEVQDEEEHGTQRKRYGTAIFAMVLGALLRIRDPVLFCSEFGSTAILLRIWIRIRLFLLKIKKSLS